MWSHYPHGVGLGGGGSPGGGVVGGWLDIQYVAQYTLNNEVNDMQ